MAGALPTREDAALKNEWLDVRIEDKRETEGHFSVRTKSNLVGGPAFCFSSIRQLCEWMAGEIKLRFGE